MNLTDISPKELIKKQIESLSASLPSEELAHGEIIYNNGQCQLLFQTSSIFNFVVDHNKIEECQIILEDDVIVPEIENSKDTWNRLTYACLLTLENELELLQPSIHEDHKKYTREGMIKRVLEERSLKALKANYKIKWADNIYGDHILINEQGIRYKIFLRDFEHETGYSDSLDAKYNKLGTTKHLIFAFNALKKDAQLFKKLDKAPPFIEIYLNPLNAFKITWFFKGELLLDEAVVYSKYFNDEGILQYHNNNDLLEFLNACKTCPRIVIRPEVEEFIETAFDDQALKEIKNNSKINYDLFKQEPFAYQKEGIEFATFKKGAIIADEMGLGKTFQAICAAIAKKEIFGFKKVLIICPTTLKAQWKKEIEKFSHEKAFIIQGPPKERAKQYATNSSLFLIANYESILRDQRQINESNIDFLILDEAQRAKNYETKTATTLKKLRSKHTLILTGTPIENNLIDIFSIVGILDPYFLGPLWEFSYQHCLFDPVKHNKINGYYNLSELKTKLSKILIRREKREILSQLPHLQQIDIPVTLSPLQEDYHASYSRGLAQIVVKKFLTPYDMLKIRQLLTSMRMVCNTTFLVDDKTHDSPKLEELQYILEEKLNLKNSNRKIIIFSEWVKMHKLIGQLLRKLNIGFTELNGSIPPKIRGKLIHKFETDPNCKVFLSTEAGGVGLNLQVADTLINFELPWNPAKKNQRIGRIDRLGQNNEKLTIYNLITKNSIEEKIATGLLVKQNLFDGVLSTQENAVDFVDFSQKGRSKFIDQVAELIAPQPKEQVYNDEITEENEEFLNQEQVEEENPNLAEEFIEPDHEFQKNAKPPQEAKETNISKSKELEEVMNNGMQFLSGLFKMSTGKELVGKDQQIKFDEETGEITIKFKLPVGN